MRIKILLLLLILFLHQINWSEEQKCSRSVLARPGQRYNGPTLYHYTTRTAASAIIKDGWLRSGPGALFGRGIYFTSMAPTKYTKNEILENNYGEVMAGYADYWIAFTPKDLQEEINGGSVLYKTISPRDVYILEDADDRKYNSQCF